MVVLQPASSPPRNNTGKNFFAETISLEGSEGAGACKVGFEALKSLAKPDG